MIIDGVDLQLNATMAAGQVSIEARVLSRQPLPLTWRLTLEATGPSGTTKVSQGGKTNGDKTGPVGAMRLNANASGRATLVVEDGSGHSATKTLELAGH